MSTAIEFNHVGKQYRLGVVSTGTIAHDLNRWWQTSVLRREDPYLKIGSVNDRAAKADSEYVWALRDIDFKVEQGDVVGIIGKNGAGKSTLLKLLSKVTAPTTGSIRARGRIASLLEVGTGFHQEMTGRENIYMNGAILGMTKQEISAKLDEIVDFSGCERYLDTPVKRYSSGMMVRLGFAVAAHLDPEILVVDEVLAVGDADFQKKAIGKMKSVSQGEGRTVLFVSHNMASVKALCKSGIVLNKGLVDYIGMVDKCVDFYIGSNYSELRNHKIIEESDRVHTGMTRELLYDEVWMLNDVNHVSNMEPLRFRARFHRTLDKVERCQFGIVIKNQSDGTPIACYSKALALPVQKKELEVEITIPHHHLTPGVYTVIMNISQNDYRSVIRDFDIVYKVLSFSVDYIDSEHQYPFALWQLDTNCANMEGFAILR